MNLKALAKDTALYGLSSIVGRFLNYLLVPLYTYKIAAESGGYGIVTNLYAYSALLLVLLTFGMETTFFRFAGKEGEDERSVYGSALRLVGGVSLAFLAAALVFLRPIAGAMGYAAHPQYIACFACIAAMDAFQAIMFARLRQQHRPIKFVALKLGFVLVNITLNLLIFLVLPRFFEASPALADFYARNDGGVGLIFYANLFCTAAVMLGFIPEMRGLAYRSEPGLARRMLRYSWPLLLLGLVGILNQVADKILFPYLMPGEEGRVQLGIYGACVKLAMIMALLTQAFRYAYEPIVFGGTEKNKPEALAQGTRYFVIFAFLAWLAVMFYMPLIRHFINPGYWEGLKVVPIVMMAEIFMGVYFNLSFWYKLSDKTWWGAVISAIGAAVMIGVNVLGVSRWGYMACAWGGFAGYGVSMLLSYFIGQRHMQVRYDLPTMGRFFCFGAVFYVAYVLLGRFGIVWQMAAGTVMLLAYCALIYKDIKQTKI